MRAHPVRRRYREGAITLALPCESTAESRENPCRCEDRSLRKLASEAASWKSVELGGALALSLSGGRQRATQRRSPDLGEPPERMARLPATTTEREPYRQTYEEKTAAGRPKMTRFVITRRHIVASLSKTVLLLGHRRSSRSCRWTTTVCGASRAKLAGNPALL
jgi:hypothetical protein